MDKLLGDLGKKERLRLAGVGVGVSFGVLLFLLEPEGWWSAIIIGGIIAFVLQWIFTKDIEQDEKFQRISRLNNSEGEGKIDLERLKRETPTSHTR